MAEVDVALAEPSEDEIAAAVSQLHTADIGTLAQVEPLARQLSHEMFAATVEKLQRRRASGSIRNDAGLFVDLLKIELRNCAAQRAMALANTGAPEQPLGLVETVKRDDPERYVRAMAAVPGFEPELEKFLAVYVCDELERERLRGVARHVRG